MKQSFFQPHPKKIKDTSLQQEKERIKLKFGALRSKLSSKLKIGLNSKQNIKNSNLESKEKETKHKIEKFSFIRKEYSIDTPPQKRGLKIICDTRKTFKTNGSPKKNIPVNPRSPLSIRLACQSRNDTSIEQKHSMNNLYSVLKKSSKMLNKGTFQEYSALSIDNGDNFGMSNNSRSFLGTSSGKLRNMASACFMKKGFVQKLSQRNVFSNNRFLSSMDLVKNGKLESERKENSFVSKSLLRSLLAGKHKR